eukprot:TRINITY_DN4670_c0_g1_i1.p1 TRINITY_DN4670_c0_g1~~TRINITY_DN4670_c0_g1_i1.p1  ORF type:complete len:213 (-),score=42.36 TRINITY_DN4670_c0_g1_i1:23-661(-)
MNLPEGTKFFVIKSYSEDDIHKSIKYSVWTSTDSGNKRLDKGYKDATSKGAPVYLFFSVNASGQFCGIAQMSSAVDYSKKCAYWNQDKWNGQFSVKWIFIKDIHNNNLRHIELQNNNNKPVTNSRDTQEVYREQGLNIIKIFSEFQLKTSILDDFEYYNKCEEEEKQKIAKPNNSGVQYKLLNSHTQAPITETAPEETHESLEKTEEPSTTN